MDRDSSLRPPSTCPVFSRRSPLIPLVLCSPSNARSREDRARHRRDSPQSGGRSLRDRRLSKARVWRRPSHARTHCGSEAEGIRKVRTILGLSQADVVRYLGTTVG